MNIIVYTSDCARVAFELVVTIGLPRLKVGPFEVVVKDMVIIKDIVIEGIVVEDITMEGIIVIIDIIVVGIIDPC